MLQTIQGYPNRISVQTVNPVWPLPKEQAGGIKVRLIRSVLTLRLLERKLQRQEREVAEAVERCTVRMQQQVSRFCSQRTAELGNRLEQLLEKFPDAASGIPALIDEHHFTELEAELKQIIQQQFNDLFAMKSINIAALHTISIDGPGLNSFARALAECRRTVCLADVMLALGNKTWEKSVGQAGQGHLLGQLLSKAEPATLFMRTLDCLPQQQKVVCRRQLSARLTGLIENSCVRLLNDFHRQTARIFYQLYDDVFARPLLRQKVFLQEKLKSNRIENPSLCRIKQAG